MLSGCHPRVHFQALQIFRSSSRPVPGTGSVTVRSISSDRTSLLSRPQSRDEQCWMQSYRLLFPVFLISKTDVHIVGGTAFALFFSFLQKLPTSCQLFVCISIGLPLHIVWMSFINDAYGSSGAWCWIRNWQNDCSADLYTPGTAEQFGLLVLALFCSIIDSIAIIVIISRLVCCQWSSEEVPLLMNEQRMKFKALKELLPLLVYPILFCILLIPLVVNRAIDAIPNSPANVVVSTMVSGIFVPLQPFFAGLALLVHVCVLKCWTCKCFRKRRQHHHTAQDTFASEHPSTWRYTQGDIFSTRNPTEACIPNESEVDSSVVSQKWLLVIHGFNNSQ